MPKKTGEKFQRLSYKSLCLQSDAADYEIARILIENIKWIQLHSDKVILK